MRLRYEFALYPIDAGDLGDGIDATLALMGAQGWEMRGITSAPGGSVVVALQRPLDEELPLPDSQTLAATLVEPLTAPTERELAE